MILNRKKAKKEGLNLNIDKEVLDDQRILEVSTELPENAKVEKEDKDEFETYKLLYKGVIDDKCLEEFGTVDDEKLWNDTAKELFLKSKTYIPEADKKADGELAKVKESTVESRRKAKHNKKITESATSDYTLSEIKKVLNSDSAEYGYTIVISNADKDIKTKTLNIDKEDLQAIYDVLAKSVVTETKESSKQDIDIKPIGTAGCEYTGGGIWCAYIPVNVDDNEYNIVLSNEEDTDELNGGGEFSLCYTDDWNLVSQYGNKGVFIFDKNSKYMSLYKELKSILDKAVKEDKPVSSKKLNELKECPKQS
jgi:hypothetical protein